MTFCVTKMAFVNKGCSRNSNCIG